MRFAPLAILLAACAPLMAYAHEVYVLPRDVVLQDLTAPPLQFVSIFLSHEHQFFFWMFISLWTILTVFLISIIKPLETKFHPSLERLKRHAPLVARLTLGAAILSSGLHGAFYGPELPFTDIVGSSANILQGTFAIGGIAIILGLFTRLVSILLILIYLLAWQHFGTYMLTYTNYFGEMCLLLILGNTVFAMDSFFHHSYPATIDRLVAWLESHAFMIMRACFGISLIYASMYAKFLHAQLAIDTVTMYGLTNYFPFDPEFIVLGAFCVELLLGVFFLLGIEVRFASLFLIFWLTLSLLYFGEAVWPHIILVGAALAIGMHGYDRYTVEWNILKRRHKNFVEPLL